MCSRKEEHVPTSSSVEFPALIYFIFFILLTCCSFGDETKWRQLAVILVVISQIAKQLRWKIMVIIIITVWSPADVPPSLWALVY